jgi:NADPH:quinone reductase-like Zn-dependent oxidoreductase
VGPNVTTARTGDRVLALTRFGGYATAVVTPAALAFPIPGQLSDIEAAATPVNYLTALIALYRLANLQKEETVLIYGAGGGVGIAATQLAKLRGASVIGTASTPKIAAIASLGVDHAIDHRRADVRADVILDSIGGRSFADSYSLLAPLGRLVIYGVSSLASGPKRRVMHTLWTLWQLPAFRPLSLMNQNRGVFGLNLGRLWDETGRLREAMALLQGELSAGRLRPVVARTFPLESAADAHRYMQSRSNIGKVVLVMEG